MDAPTCAFPPSRSIDASESITYTACFDLTASSGRHVHAATRTMTQAFSIYGNIIGSPSVWFSAGRRSSKGHTMTLENAVVIVAVACLAVRTCCPYNTIHGQRANRRFRSHHGLSHAHPLCRYASRDVKPGRRRRMRCIPSSDRRKAKRRENKRLRADRRLLGMARSACSNCRNNILGVEFRGYAPTYYAHYSLTDQSASVYISSSSSQLQSVSKDDMELAPVDSDSGARESQPSSSAKGFRFAMVFVAICISMFMSALEFSAVSTALPTIVHDLSGEDFIWVASSYALASTAFLPASGGMAELFGRQATMLVALALFALGSALSGAARNMNWLIAARTIQGAGGGCILSIGSIILSDLVSLRERGLYNGMIGLTWAVAAGIGPLVGGSLAESGHWRWLFYINLPISGFAAVLVILFLRLRTPPGSFREKLLRMDWVGNFIIIAASTSACIGLTWGGVRFAWSSAQVLVPLILGLVGIIVFLIYEATWAKDPVVPFALLSNRTSLSGYIQTFINPIINVAVIYYLSVYYQACKGSSPIHSAVQVLSLSISVGPSILITGASIQATKSYRAQHWIGWVLLLVAMGTLSTLKNDTPVGHGVGFAALEGVGVGMIYASTYFPVLAPLPVTENAHALAFFAFCRSFASVWGVTIGGTILQTQLTKRLPADFTAQFPQGVAIAYTSITAVRTLDEPLRTQVREAYAQSLTVIWQVMIGIAGIGFLASLAMKALPLHTDVDKKWGLQESGPTPLELQSPNTKLTDAER
ncbi:hypothetical protein NM688_g271 [Phlebia brevispora]|uniref:Uncharacterized protein n=1 Tax=Phlebia brevispora TaxID=194682 RepID=A0ACC1TEJ2_9APHY|nr:hypothetical protein NM688_g271 [Phlebia brevispora]